MFSYFAFIMLIGLVVPILVVLSLDPNFLRPKSCFLIFQEATYLFLAPLLRLNIVSCR